MLRFYSCISKCFQDIFIAFFPFNSTLVWLCVPNYSRLLIKICFLNYLFSANQHTMLASHSALCFHEISELTGCFIVMWLTRYGSPQLTSSTYFNRFCSLYWCSGYKSWRWFIWIPSSSCSNLLSSKTN